MGQKQSNKTKEINSDNPSMEDFEEKNLFKSFQKKQLKLEICAITYFRFESDDIIENNTKQPKEINETNNNALINNLNLTIESSLGEEKNNSGKKDSNKKKSIKKKKTKKIIYLEKSQIINIPFLFIEVVGNIVYVMDAHSFDKIFKFREESKANINICKKMFQSEYHKSLLICIHERKININKIKIINSLNKSSIYCEQIQNISFEKEYISINDIKELNDVQSVILMEECFLIFEKTNKDKEINMSTNEEKKLNDKILTESNFPEDRDGYKIRNKGDHHFIPFKAFNFKNFKNNKILSSQKIYIKNIIQINNVLFIILINASNISKSVLRFYYFYEKQINYDEKTDIVINDYKYKGFNLSKIFNINEKYFGYINIENIVIVSAITKEIVSIYVINEMKMNITDTNENTQINFFLPWSFLVFNDYHFLIQFIDVKTKNIYLKMFKFIITKSNTFVEIFNVTKKRIKTDDFIYNILSFKDVKDIKQNDANFCAKFFITNNKNNMIKKWIITNYEKDS